MTFCMASNDGVGGCVTPATSGPRRSDVVLRELGERLAAVDRYQAGSGELALDLFVDGWPAKAS
jgi:hypothetical protein